MQKSPEQLEKEKREIISSRLLRLDLNGKTKDDLVKQAEEFYQALISLHSQIYDLTEKHDRQRYDMMELAERARQIEKGKAKTRKSNIVHTGLGGSVFPWLTEATSTAPQKISLFSRYERVTDRRTFKDRRDLWAAEKPKKDFVPEKPKAKIKHIEPPKDGGKKRNNRRLALEEEAKQEADAANAANEPQEERAPEEEAPAEEVAQAEEEAAEEE